MLVLNRLVEDELSNFHGFRNSAKTVEAWAMLERAHILSQSDAWLHTKVHWMMLRYGFEQRDWIEVWGQISRLAIACIGSALRKAPAGNTGRARMPIIATAPVPDDLAKKIEGARKL